MVGLRVLLLWDVLCEVGRRMKAPAKAIAHRSMAKRRRTWGKLAIAKYWENRAELRDHETSEVDSCKSIWAVLKRSFISQGRKELLTPPLLDHLCGHSDCLRVGIPVFCLRASLRWLMHVLMTTSLLSTWRGGLQHGSFGKIQKKTVCNCLDSGTKTSPNNAPKIAWIVEPSRAQGWWMSL